MNIALLGTPNCGKSTLFSLLTGVRTVTGNRPGVTVSVKSAPFSHSPHLLFDLPGIRSFPPSSEDEKVSFSFLRSGKADLILLVLDVCAPNAGIELLQNLLTQKFPVPPILTVWNCCDRLTRSPSLQELESLCGFPCAVISARTGEGIPELNRKITSLSSQKERRGSHKIKKDELVLLFKSLRKKESALAVFLDTVFSSKATGIPAFFLISFLLLYLCFGDFGNYLTGLFCRLFLSPLSALCNRLFSRTPVWGDFVIDGLLGGIGAVLSFLPRIAVLFFFESFLEQSGMLDRVSFLFDGIFSKVGLRGDAIAPLLLGFGCSVPAIASTKGMKDETAALRCSLCLPSVACSARLPLVLCVCDGFFQKAKVFICIGVWIFSGLCFFLFAKISALFFRVNEPPVRHKDLLSRWQLPALSDLLGSMTEELKNFLYRIAGPIFGCSVAVWLLSHIRFGVAGWVPMEESALAFFGKLLSPLFSPLGFSDWKISSALICGLGAKEAALSTLAILLVGESLSLALTSAGIFTCASALSFLTFYTLYFPCLATLFTLSERLKRKRKKLVFLLLPLLFAWVFSMIVYRVSLLLF